MPQVVVTRPKQDANSWVQALSDAGYQAIEFPLLELSEFLNAQTAQDALVQIKRSQAVMFVSANAVRFLAQALEGQSDWVAHFKMALALGARAQVQRLHWYRLGCLSNKSISQLCKLSNSIPRLCGRWYQPK